MITVYPMARASSLAIDLVRRCSGTADVVAQEESGANAVLGLVGWVGEVFSSIWSTGEPGRAPEHAAVAAPGSSDGPARDFIRNG